jgi:hypothetical protein
MLRTRTLAGRACFGAPGRTAQPSSRQHKLCMPHAVTMTSVDMTKDHAEESLRQSDAGGNETAEPDSLRGAPEWIKLTAIALTSALVALVEVAVCKRALLPACQLMRMLAADCAEHPGIDHWQTLGGSCTCKVRSAVLACAMQFPISEPSKPPVCST